LRQQYAISQKLAYEKRARHDLEVNLKVALKSLQNDQVIIVGQEVELNDLKNVAHYAMDMIAVQVEGEEPNSALDRIIVIPDRLLTLLKATSLEAATDALVRVKSHYLDVDMVKVKGGADTTKDLKALELEVRDAAMEVMDTLDNEGDDGEE
jgi:septum formation topological specificity factor MinE